MAISSAPLPDRVDDALSRDFWVFWGGQAVSTLGSSFTGFALPLLIFKLTGSAVNLGASMAVAYLPYLLFGLIIGAWTDRLDRKRLMIVVNVMFAVTIGVIPATAALGHLSIGLIYCVQFVSATLRLFFTSAAFAAIPSLVPRNRLVTANGRMQASYSAMSVIGPILAGGLAAFLPLPSLLVIDSTSYLVSALALLTVRSGFNEIARPHGPGSIRAEVKEGLAFVFGHPVLRSVSIMMALVNFASMTVAAQLVFFAKVQLHATTTEVGLLFAANAVGVLLLTLFAGALRRRLPFSRVTLGLLEIQGFVTIVIAQLHLFWAVLPLIALWQGLGVLFSINTTSLRQEVTPNHLLGRVVTTANVLGGAVIPLGTLAGGFAIQRTGNIALVFSAIGVIVFVLPILFSFSPLGHAERYLERAPEPEQIDEPALGRWLEAASEATRNQEDSQGALDLQRLPEEDLQAIGAGLAAIHEASREVTVRLSRLVERPPEPAALEEALVAVGGDMEDVAYHWEDLVHRLQSRDLYPLDGNGAADLEKKGE